MPWLINHHAMQTYGGVEVQLHTVLIPSLYGGEWSVSGPDRFSSGESAPNIHCVGGWVGPRANLGGGKKKCSPFIARAWH